MSDRRGAFFVLASVAAGALSFVADPDHRWVAIALATAYAVLAVASFLDAHARDRIPPRVRPGGAGDGGQAAK